MLKKFKHSLIIFIIIVCTIYKRLLHFCKPKLCLYIYLNKKQKNSECLKLKTTTYFDNVMNLIESKKQELLNFIQKEEEAKKKVSIYFLF